jgi:ABC-type uncharacterized transport system, permease component
MTGKYLCAYRSGFLTALEYRADYIFSILTAIMPIFIQIFIWSNVFIGGSGSVFGYTFSQMICYAVLCNFVNNFINSGIHELVNFDIKTGNLNSYLIKPVNYVAFRASGVMGGKTTEFFIVSLLGMSALGFLAVYSHLEITYYNVLLFVVSIILAFFLNFFIFLCFSFTAFWVTDTANIFHTFQVVVSVIGGAIFPLDVFGNTFLKISDYLPFKNLVYVPLNIIMGKLTSDQTIQSLTVQALWLLLFIVVSVGMWKKGTKKYIGIGG